MTLSKEIVVTLADIKNKAKEVGVKGYTKLPKPELVKAIQTAEGNSPCYQSEIASVCGIADCMWKEDCAS